MPQAAKRAGASLGGSQKRARDDTALKCDEVALALKSAQDLPDSMRDMLTVGAVGVLSRFKEERHAYQSAVVGWIEEALGTVQASHEQRSAELKAKVDGAEAAMASLDGLVARAQDTLAQLQNASVDAQMKGSNLDVDAQSADAALRDAKAAEEDAGAETEVAAAKKVDLEALLAPDGQLAKWQIQAADKREAAAFVKALRSKSKFEQVLLQCLVPTFMVDLATRTDFDQLVLKHLEEALTKDIAAQAAVLDAAAPVKSERATAVSEAQLALETAKAAAQAGGAAAAIAEAAAKQGEADLKAAQKALDDHGPAAKAASLGHRSAEVLLEEFRNGPVTSFQELRDRTVPVEEAPAEAAVEAPCGAVAEAIPGA